VGVVLFTPLHHATLLHFTHEVNSCSGRRQGRLWRHIALVRQSFGVECLDIGCGGYIPGRRKVQLLIGWTWIARQSLTRPHLNSARVQ
jgi:hypothetical protein